MNVKITEKERIAWCYSFKSGKRWLNAIMVDKTGSKHTEREYSRGLYTYCEWISKTPDQLITERKKDTEHNAEDKVREFCLWLTQTRKITRTTIATKYHAVIKSFYNYNDFPLRLRTPKHTMRRRSPHTIEEIKTLMKIADIRKKAIMMVLKDSGMSREDVVKLTYGDIKAEFEAGKKFIHLKVTRQKEAIEYDTFIGENAVEILKVYLDYRMRMGETIDEHSPLLATIGGKSLTAETLSSIFVRFGRKAGFKTSSHRFRKFFESHLGLSAPSMLVKYWMGHSLGVEGHYFIPPVEKQLEKYKESYKELDIFEKVVDEREMRINAMLDNARLMGWTEEKLFAFEDFMRKATLRTKAIPLENMVKEFLKLYNETQDCQKMIDPEELETYLKNGWHFIAQVNGKIVVSND